ncbi:gp68 [Isoalcanivorax pacificus W11-5]|uniref:Gp68 n=1 Tax=Isoalcanivorax pacificus W11-5 TaxID=391936 RepID=A0A0B4XKD3_9GAMM|nr:phage Gp37/Gp68 family protein [Isoalcanivorax pacificus]AJD47546.1 gp68 [Isoalcanivorax pacificus W11-5]
MSKIEWTEQTWNPVTGCTKVSPGCKHCYAETMAHRLQAMGAPGYENGFGLSLLPERLAQPLRRRKPTMYFVNSMSDLFQDGVPDSFIDQVMEVIRTTPQHTYQILTKRSGNMRDYFAGRRVPDNAWLGVSVEDRKYGKPRITELQAIKARTRFLSVEPLLEDLGHMNLKGIHWVIVGGESGVGARPMKQEWALNIRNQCLTEGVDFFFKQWGAWGADGKQRTKKANGRLLDGQVWNMIPSVMV